MASAFGHATLAVTLGTFRDKRYRSPRFWICLVACSVVPDLDVLGFHLGVPYGSMLGHRGFTHSIAFAVFLSAVLSILFFREKKGFSTDGWKTAFLLFLSTMSHGILDACTSGGLGVGFFIPFSSERFFFPFRPIRVSPISIGQFFSGRGLVVISSEILWIGLPCFLLLLVNFAVKRRQAGRTLDFDK